MVVDLRGHERRLAVHAGEEARAPTWSPDGRFIAFVNRIGESYFVEFVDVRSGKPVGRWRPGGAFEGADPSWDATAVYIPSA